MLVLYPQSLLLTRETSSSRAYGRSATFNVGSDRMTINQDHFGNDQGIVISYRYIADGSGTVTLTYTPTDAPSTIHTYAVANRVANDSVPVIGVQPMNTFAAAGSTAIRVRIGGTVLTARLRDVPASRDLVAQLPLTLTFRDFNNVEKISRLPRELSVDGVPAGEDPAPRDIGYYAPSGDLVFYYGDVGYFPGIVRLGQFDGSVDAVQNQTGEFAATVELAG